MPKVKTAFITGASRGIGRAIAKKFSESGIKVTCTSRTAKNLEQIVSEIEENDGTALATPIDVSEMTAFEEAVKKSAEKFGSIDVLVNNAGILRQVNFETGDEEDLDEMWAVNVKAPFRLTRLAMPALKQCGNGRIVNIASTDGLRFRDNSASVGYTMSKHALVAMTHAARQFGYADGVRATANVRARSIPR